MLKCSTYYLFSQCYFFLFSIPSRETVPLEKKALGMRTMHKGLSTEDCIIPGQLTGPEQIARGRRTRGGGDMLCGKVRRRICPWQDVRQ